MIVTGNVIGLFVVISDSAMLVGFFVVAIVCTVECISADMLPVFVEIWMKSVVVLLSIAKNAMSEKIWCQCKFNNSFDLEKRSFFALKLKHTKDLYFLSYMYNCTNEEVFYITMTL